MITDSGGTALAMHDYAPFGQETQPPDVNNSRRFAGKERGTVTGFDRECQGTGVRVSLTLSAKVLNVKTKHRLTPIGEIVSVSKVKVPINDLPSTNRVDQATT